MTSAALLLLSLGAPLPQGFKPGRAWSRSKYYPGNVQLSCLDIHSEPWSEYACGLLFAEY